MKSFQAGNLIINFLLFLRVKQGSDFWRRRPWQSSLLSVLSVIWKTHLAIDEIIESAFSPNTVYRDCFLQVVLSNLIIIKSQFEKHKQHISCWPWTAQEHRNKRGQVPSPTGNLLAFFVWLSFALLNCSPTNLYQKAALDPLLQCWLNIFWAHLLLLQWEAEGGRKNICSSDNFISSNTHHELQLWRSNP